MKIGIIGHGFVGKAIDKGFSRDVKKIVIDPKYGNNIEELKNFDPNYVFICVPTPMGDDHQDYKILDQVITDISSINLKDCIFILKSTILPDKISSIGKELKNLIYNPEFLRENHADEDFKNSEFVILGGSEEHALKVKKLYQQHSLCQTISDNYLITSAKVPSITKYTINTYLATKVIFFNQIFPLFQKENNVEEYQDFVRIISHDKRIGKSHMNVPGFDGRFGFGGACFPKDSYAFIKHFQEKGISLTVLENAFAENNKIRSKYKEKTTREIEQNVTFENLYKSSPKK